MKLVRVVRVVRVVRFRSDRMNKVRDEWLGASVIDPYEWQPTPLIDTDFGNLGRERKKGGGLHI